MFIYYRICNNNFSLGSNNRFTEICAVLRLTQRLTTCISCICSTHLVLRFNLSLHANLQVYTVCLCVPTHPGSLRSWIWCYVDKTHLYTGECIYFLVVPPPLYICRLCLVIVACASCFLGGASEPLRDAFRLHYATHSLSSRARLCAPSHKRRNAFL